MRISGKIPALLMVVMLVLGTAGFPVTINAAPEVKPAVETSAVQAASTENETVDAEAAKPDGDNNAEEVNPGTVSERVPTTTDDARQGEMLKKPASAVITETSPLTIAGHPSETPDTESVLSEVGIRSMVPAEDVAEAETASVPKQLRNIPVTRSTTSIWLNGQTGDDANDGLKTETAVRTFARAKALATENPDITTIYINGTVDIAGDISLAGTTAHLERAPGYDGYLLRILKDTEVRLTDIRVDGGGKAAVPIEKNSLIYVQQGTLNIGTGAVLENNVRGDTTKNILRGGAIYAYRSHIVMTDGAIQGNRATYGGGVYLSKSVFDMTGGTIRDNLAKRVSDTGIYAAGGGVTINDGSTMNLSGTALVEHNQSDEVGGGISVGTNQWSDGKDYLNMTGGTINANEAGSAGGGIFVQVGFGARFSTATVTGGNITNNRMNGSGWTEKAFGGGGIYVNGIQEDWYGYTWSKGMLYIQNAIITDNEAAYEGGGFASCPVSETKIKINNGVAFYGNRSGRGAREIYILASDEYGSHSGLPPYEITDTMLGGVKYEWQDENGALYPKEKLKGRLENYGDYIGLQTNALPNEKTIRLAKVLISGNTSVTRGAAIGSNGRVVIGTEGEKTEVPVQKVWSDQENKYGYRPETITVRLLADGEPVETLVLKAENNWQGAFVYLDVEREGQPIVYTVEEVSVPEYKTSISGNATDGYTITNTLNEPKPVSVPVEKVWQDKDDHYGYRPAEITVKLLANGVSTGKTLTLTEGNNWRGVFENLDAVSGGKPIVYTVEEVSVPEYKTSISGSATDGYTITNTLNEPKPVSVPVEKVWQDKDDHYGYRPVEITVKLLANGVSTGKTLTLTEGNDWHGVFENLDAVSGGKPIVYTVEEVSVPKYKTSISGNATDGYTITNTLKEPKPVSVPVEKVWQDKDDHYGYRPVEITVKLLANGVLTGKTLTLTEGNDWHGVFENLDAVSGGEAIVYTVEEVSVPEYMTSISGNATDGYTITNTLKEPKPVSVPVEKVWQDKDDHYGYRPTEITVKLLANGVSTGKTLTLTEGNDWRGVFENLDAVSGGKPIVYTVEEVSVPEYMTSISGNATDGYTIINTLNEPKPVSVPVEKVWHDKDDHYGYRPAEITVKLLANGVLTGKTLTLTEENNWRGVFENLDAVSGGEAIVYTVEEVSVPEYKTNISGNATDGYTITNTVVPLSDPPRKQQKRMPYTGAGTIRCLFVLLATGGIILAGMRRKKETK